MKIENKLIKHIPIAWMIGISALVLFSASSLRHFMFQSTALDLAVFDQWVYLVSQNLPPISSFFGFHIVGDHAAFILYFIALLYKIYPDIHWLFAVQAIALALGALPIYLLSLKIGLSIAYARAIAISYLLYPALFNINLYTDFRPEAIAVPSLLWAMSAGISSKTSQLILAVALALMCKDTLSLTVIALGLWFWFIQKQRDYGIGCMVAGAVWYLLTIGYLVPMLRGGQAGGVVFFNSLGHSPSEIILNIFTNPSLIINKFFLPDTLFYYFLLVLPVILGLHWRQVMMIVPALPMLLLNIISDYSAQRDLIHHYSLPIFPFIIVWLLYSIRQYQNEQKRRWLKPSVLMIWAIASFLVLGKYDFFVTRYLTNLPNFHSLQTAVSLVKTQGSLLTTPKIAPHLSHRPIIKLTDKLSNINWESSQNKSIYFEYVLLYLMDINTKNSPELTNLVNQFINNPEFKLEYHNKDVYLFTKN
ncbi:DUF2079 domain-containing protein [Anabaena sp. WFMT]|uniref:DUF2079 domain-containing protein n=1 Tax=Anabaena sp. WFMT TaxID=3449730 RepID=UPI003F29CD36